MTNFLKQKMKNTTQHIIFNFAYITFGILSLFLIKDISLLLYVWLFIAFGNGTIGHRYFSHNQFSVHKTLHWPLACWSTISAYSNTGYWIAQHRHHHRHTDTEKDIHSPVNGVLQSFIFWPFNNKRIDSVFKDRTTIINMATAMRDPAISFTTKYFIPINLIFIILFCIIDINIAYCFGISVIIEHVRLGLINTITHTDNFLGNYRNHNTKDKSYNNLLLGIISLGFGWHNNHHANASKLILTERWWEIDLEGYLGKLLSLTARGKK